MSQQDRDKWNQRYADGRYHNSNPVTLLQAWLPRLPVGRALDVACGSGRNASLLARAGYQVDAIDISPVGLKLARQNAQNHGLGINWIEQDLELPYAFETDYSLIIVMWYVDLGLITRLCDCLVPGGYLICEEHLITHQAVAGPASKHYRVAPGALREAVSGLDIRLYEESVETNADGQTIASARVVGRKPAGPEIVECSQNTAGPV